MSFGGVDPLERGRPRWMGDRGEFAGANGAARDRTTAVLPANAVGRGRP